VEQEVSTSLPLLTVKGPLSVFRLTAEVTEEGLAARVLRAEDAVVACSSSDGGILRRRLGRNASELWRTAGLW
jgi:hypothetical protein